VVPPLHTVPQEPQSALSVCKSTHAPPHAVCPDVHVTVHMPFEQSWPGPQTLLQLPQWFGSLVVSTQTPLQSLWPGGQTHMPPAQLAPVGHALPHLPQSALSVCRFTHWPLQLVSPVPHCEAH
jgi:hypothetical protein